MSTWRTHLGAFAVCGMPLINYCYVLAFWLLASAALGSWAQPNLNDPKGFLFGIPALVGVVLTLASFAVAPLVIFIGYRRQKTLEHVVTYVVCLGLSISLFRLDILQITSWIAD